MGRRKAREISLKFLFSLDIGKATNIEEEFSKFTKHFGFKNEDDKRFSFILAKGVLENLSYIDSVIEKYALGWRLDRLFSVDRNILRMGIYELLFMDDIPPAVTINEAVEIAKKYGTEKSPSFVNGILDRVAKEEVKELNKV